MNQPTDLRCEYFVNPLAIDVPKPRLSWIVNDDRRGAKQSAYQVIVTSGENTLWDSGKVESDQSIQIEYGGSPLASRMRCQWKVRTWDEQGKESPWSETATWEMAFLNRGDWKGQWIGSPIVGGPYSIPPAPYLRKTFTFRKPVASARLYVTALGIYEIEINGKRVGDAVFAPGRTEYAKRVPYHVYDVTAHLAAGENVCGAILGDGWYCGHLHSDPRQTYGDRPRLLAQLEITFADGSTQMIVSDGSWKAGEGPIRSSDMLMGEDYDARMEIPGWSAAGFVSSPGTPGEGQGEGSSPGSTNQRPSPQPSPWVQGEGGRAEWRPVIVFPDPGIEIVAHRSPPVKKIQEIKPVGPPIISANKRRQLFDMGQNMVGWVRLRFRNAPPGVTVGMRFSEMLDKDGKPYTTALRSARATDHYTTRGGGGEEVYEPRFTFHGFRYVEVRDYPGTLSPDDLTGIVVHSDTPPTGEFECSDPMLNQLQHNIVWSQKGNFLDIPTDCPQRDERLGWTGDAQVFIRTASFNMDVAGFFTKWLQDVADSQYSDGHIPSVVPHVKSIHHEGGPAWADAAVICPWTVYLCYGDKRILEDRWGTMSGFMRYLRDTSPGYIRADESNKWRGYGDWLSMNAVTPPDLIGTAFYAHCAQLMSKMAFALGKTDEAAAYEKLFDDVRVAWQKRFVTADGQITVKTQTAYVLALHFDLLPERHRPAVFAALLEDIKSRDMHLSTGFVGTPYLNHVLTRFGRPDVAFTLLTQKTFPSWLFPITHGATTMWERWDGWTPEQGFNDAGMNSYNHYAYGVIGDWMYAAVAGIDLDQRQPGYKHIVIRPHVGGGLSSARAILHSMHGLIASGWRVEKKQLHLDVTIPANTAATIRIPTADAAKITESGKPVAESQGLRFISAQDGKAIYEAGAGKYSFVSTLPA